MNYYWVCGLTEFGSYIKHGPYNKARAHLEWDKLRKQYPSYIVNVYEQVEGACAPSRGGEEARTESIGTATLEIVPDMRKLHGALYDLADRFEDVARTLRG